ncbi:unnamed protein product, partial [Staurois parvus]
RGLRLSITGSRPVITHRSPVIAEYLQWEGELYVKLYSSLLLVSSCTLLWMASSVITVKHTHRAYSKTAHS